MCYLCLMENPFAIKDLSKENTNIKKARAKLIKEFLIAYEADPVCDDGQIEIDKLKEQQYKLSREI